MTVTPGTVVLLTLAFVSLLATGMTPFVVEHDDNLRTATFFGALVTLVMLVLGFAALADDIDRSLTKAAPTAATAAPSVPPAEQVCPR